MEPLTSNFRNNVDRHPDRDFIVFPDARMTYAETDELALRVAKSLYAMGVRSSDRVGILMANSFDYVGVLFGISYLGAIPVLYNGRFKAREIAHVTSDADIKVIITSDQIDEHTDYGELLHSALPGLEEYRFGMERSINKNTPNLEAAVMFVEKDIDVFINQ